MFKAKLYLDFDGVINAVNPQHDLITNFDIASTNDKIFAKINNMTYSPTVVEALDNFRDFYDVELVWLSSWNDQQDVLKLPPFLNGLHGGRVLEANLNYEATNKHEWTQWKADAIIADQKMNPLPFVWIDDNAHNFHMETVKLATHGTHKSFVQPISDHGLTTENLKTISDFLTITTSN